MPTCTLMLKILSFVLLGLSLVIWLITNYKATQCGQNPSINLLKSQDSSQIHFYQEKKKGLAGEPPPSQNEGIESLLKVRL